MPYIVLQTNKVSGTAIAHGPFDDKRNARKAVEWLEYGPWTAAVVKLIPVKEGDQT